MLYYAGVIQKIKKVEDVFWDTGHIALKSKIESRARYVPELSENYGALFLQPVKHR